MVRGCLQSHNGLYSLYFHIPFCSKKCDYCHFYVIPDQTRYKEMYMAALRKEWQLRKSLLPQSGLVSVYFGGGTPDLLGPHSIHEILSWINPPEDCEITLEVNPENVSRYSMQDFRSCGINRVSLGVQTLDDNLLRTLSRTHSVEHSLAAIDATLQAGIDNISIDLMYDLPSQTLSSWQHTLSQAIVLPIKHLSLYNLTIEPHTVFYKKRSTLKIPSAKTSLNMLQSAVTLFKQNGFHRYEISAFAKEEKFSRHNIGYWTERPFLGFGPSASSFWQNSRFRNVAHLGKYSKALQEGRDPMDFKETLSSQARLQESLALRCRLIDGIPLTTWPVAIQTGLADLQKKGLLMQKKGFLQLTAKGLLLHDTVAEEIMSW